MASRKLAGMSTDSCAVSEKQTIVVEHLHMTSPVYVLRARWKRRKLLFPRWTVAV